MADILPSKTKDTLCISYFQRFLPMSSGLAAARAASCSSLLSWFCCCAADFVIRKTIPRLLATTLTVACLLTACSSPRVKAPSGSDAAPATRNNCYSLLHQLLDEQKDVSILRFIKREHSDVKKLIKKIAVASGAGSKLLEEFARQDASIDLKDFRLPSGEAATREAIASTKRKELLGQTGDTFELTLLLTQTEALSYAAHLAKVAGENESHPDRARALSGVSAEMQSLYQEVFAMLLSKSRLSAKNG